MVEIRVYASTIVSAIPAMVYGIMFVVFAIGLIALLSWKGIRTGGRYVAVLALAEWTMLVLCSTVIFRSVRAERGFRLIPFSSYWDYGPNSYLLEVAAEKFLNVVLFVPVGFLLGRGFWQMTWRRALLTGCCLSVVIELLQLVFQKGMCEVDDVIHNVAGCMIGYSLYSFFHSHITVRHKSKCCIL